MYVCICTHLRRCVVVGGASQVLHWCTFGASVHTSPSAWRMQLENYRKLFAQSHIDILWYDLIQKSLRKYSQLILLVTLIIIFWPQKKRLPSNQYAIHLMFT